MLSSRLTVRVWILCRRLQRTLILDEAFITRKSKRFDSTTAADSIWAGAEAGPLKKKTPPLYTTNRLPFFLQAVGITVAEL